MVLIELTKHQQQIFRSKFPDVKSIADKLDKDDLYRICGGDFKDSPYIVYRDIHYENNQPVGFIDVYSFDEQNMYIVLAILKEYRGKGIAQKLVSKMERNINVKSIKYIVWKTDKDNISSQKLAVKMGYKFYHHTKTSKSYMKSNPSYKRTDK